MRNSRLLADAHRLVVKIGSVLLVEAKSGEIYHQWLAALAEDVSMCRARGQEVILVSSGAVAVGRRHLNLPARTLRLEESQAAAATGQARLAHAYQEALEKHDITTAQILLTLDDTEERRRHLNARETIDTLLALGVVPVINENDTVATEEIRFGDNDRLAARVAQMVGADTLVLLSDVDGLYTADPSEDPEARPVAEVREITSEIEAMAGEERSEDGSGGMITKLIAARIALAAGCRMAIALGRPLHALSAIDSEKSTAATWFLPSASPKTAHKRWIAASLKPSGVIIIDSGAQAALSSGNSLLPAGVANVEGDFKRGDAVLIHGVDGHELGRGLSAYSADDARRILGHKSDEIEAILGYRGREEMIHRDDLALD
ncbi:MAG: glutamate 5-kinase [Rhodospirillaceae bacterium]|nr:glutamate 5-kinase [Rhodospirillaceae bacterium]MBT5752588.1 glutamate 5-kinase [Rhodospirillaceae bacterium]